MSINARQCTVMSTTYAVIINTYINNKHNVTSYYSNYLEHLSLYVFIYTLMSMYTQHYGGRYV
jgi:hypothetical protein